MFKASQLVAFVLSMVGMPYWYGTCVYMCSTSVLNSKKKQYPSHYGDSRMSKYNAAIAAKKVCMDCVGMIKGFFWTNGGKGVVEYINGGAAFTNKYGSNGCPDKSANGMLDWCKSKGCKWGKIATLPDVPGILLFSSGHVGVYIGGGYAVEARGFNYGVVKTRVKDRSWVNWAYLPETLLTYDNAPVAVTDPDELSKGDKGEAVTAMQKLLIERGYNLPKYGADGDFGSETLSALKAFQTDAGLTVTGVYDTATRAALKAVVTPEPVSEPVQEVKRTATATADAKTIWSYLMALIGNAFGVAGLMGNLYAESALKPINLQGSYESKLGFTDQTYTDAVDNGSYTNFVKDSAGYGLAQWTYWSRKENLLKYAQSINSSIGNLETQLEFLYKELSEGYKSVLTALKEAKSVREASDVVLTKFERPANQGESVQIKRAGYGEKYYNEYAVTTPAAPAPVETDETATFKIDYAKSKKEGIDRGQTLTTTANLNMRTGAGTHKTVIKVLKKGTKVTWYGFYTNYDGRDWYLVVSNGQTGFCSSKYLA